MENPNIQANLADTDQKEIKEEPLKIGSIISISHYQEEFSFLHSDGHIKKRLTVRNFTRPKESQQGPEFNSQGPFDFSSNYKFQGYNEQNQNTNEKKYSFSSCLFQVFPRMANVTKKEIIHDNLDIDEDTVEEDIIWENLIQEKGLNQVLDKSKIHECQTTILEEYKYNFDQFLKLQNTSVNYHQPIQLMHIDSSKFLCCHPQKMAKEQKESYELSLQDYTSDATLFKIIPAFNYQNDGDQVVFNNEIVQIVRAIPFHNKATYVHAYYNEAELKRKQSLKLNLNLDNKNFFNKGESAQKEKLESSTLAPHPIKQIDFQSQYCNPKGILDSQDFTERKKHIMKREANCSLEEPYKWKVNLFQDYIAESHKYLLCYDIIWLHHSETSSTIMATMNKDQKILDLDHLYNAKNLDISMGSSNPSDSFKEYTGDTFGMWIIENKEFQKGGFVQYEKQYRLKHLTSGLFLSVQKNPLYNHDPEGSQGSQNLKSSMYVRMNTRRKATINKNNQMETQDVMPQYYITLTSVPDHTTLFTFETLIKQDNSHDDQDKRIKASSFVFLKHCDYDGYVHVINPYNSSVNTQFKKKQQFQLETCISRLKSEDQVFNLYQASESEVWEIKYVMQCFQKFLKLINVLQNSVRTESITRENSKNLSQRINQSIKLFKQLEQFLNNMHNSSSIDHKYGTINFFRQKLLREQHYIEILFKILEEALTGDEIINWTRYEELKKLRTYETDKSKLFSQSIMEKRSDASVDHKSAMTDRSLYMSTMGGNFSKRMHGHSQQLSDFEYLSFLNQKVQLCFSCYSVLTSICKNNQKNQERYFQQVPKIYRHFRYFPEAVDSLISIIKNNEDLILKLGDNFSVQKIPKYDAKIRKLNLIDAKQYLLFQQQTHSNQNTLQIQDRSPSNLNNNNEQQDNTLQFNNFVLNTEPDNGVDLSPVINPNQQQQMLSQNQMSNKNFVEGSNRIYFDGKEMNRNHVNLMYFFFKILMENYQDTNVQIQCYKFLKCACRFQDDGVTQNQEVIYTLFQHFQDHESVQNIQMTNFFTDGVINMKSKQARLICNQLSFYSDLALARNFLWKEKLSPIFQLKDLLLHIWGKQQENVVAHYQNDLKSQLAKLSTTLYIDHDPLHKQISPQLCRIFKGNYQQSYYKNVFQNKLDIQDLYLQMIQNIKEYYQTFSDDVTNVFKLVDPTSKKKKKDEISKQDYKLIQQDLLQNKLLNTTTDILNIILQLNLYGILDQNLDYKVLIQFLLNILCYDKSNLEYSSACYNSYQIETKKRIKKKEKETKVLEGVGGFVGDFATGLLGGMKDLANTLGVIAEVDKGADEEDDMMTFNMGSAEDSALFAHPLRRGLLMINNILSSIHFEEYQMIEVQIKIKSQICDILNQLLDFRQDFLISNIIHWFTHTIAYKQIEIDYDNDDENEEPSCGIDYDKIIKEYLKGLLPNISKTGIMDVDEEYKPKEDTDKGGGLVDRLKNVQNVVKNAFAKKKTYKFTNYFKELQPQADKKREKDLQKSQIRDQKRSNQIISNGDQSARMSPLKSQAGKSTGSVPFRDHQHSPLGNFTSKIAAAGGAGIGLEPPSQIRSEVDSLMSGIRKAGVSGYQKLEEFYDLDTLFSMATENSNDDQYPIAACLPLLLSSFIVTHDEGLEKKMLKVIMRLFNQRMELIENLKNIQIVFQEENRNLYLYLTRVSNEIKKYIELSEIWLSEYIKPEQMNSEDNDFFSQICKMDIHGNKVYPIDIVQKLLSNIRNGFYHNLEFQVDFENLDEDEVNHHILSDQIRVNPELGNVIDKNKQKMFNYLKIYESIIDFLKDGLHHYKIGIESNHLSKEKKENLTLLFQTAFGILTNFVVGNGTNQVIMYQYLSIFLSHLQYDLGQIDLICEIFKNNFELISKVDLGLIQKLSEAIVQQGRQTKFLNFFLNLIKYHQKYVFDNQLLVLNTFLPIGSKKRGKILLFAKISESDVEPAQKSQTSPKEASLKTPKSQKFSSGSKEEKAPKNVQIQDNFENEIIFDFEDHTTDKNVKVEIEDVKGEVEEQLQHKNSKDEPFVYHSKLLELLLQTTYIHEQDEKDPWESEINYNILIAKLKKTFKASSLLQLLMLKDDYINENQFLDPSQQKKSGTNKLSKNNKENSSDSIFEDVIKQQKMKKGMSQIKPKLLQFLRVLHVQSEKYQNISRNENILEFRKEIGLFLNEVTNQLEKVTTQNIYNKRYINYLFDDILNFVLCYIGKYIQKDYDASGGLNNDDDRHDEKALQNLSRAFQKQINMFEDKITHGQILRVQKFINEDCFFEQDQNQVQKPIFIVKFEGISHDQQIIQNMEGAGAGNSSGQGSKISSSLARNKFAGVFKFKKNPQQQSQEGIPKSVTINLDKDEDSVNQNASEFDHVLEEQKTEKTERLKNNNNDQSQDKSVSEKPKIMPEIELQKATSKLLTQPQLKMQRQGSSEQNSSKTRPQRKSVSAKKKNPLNLVSAVGKFMTGKKKKIRINEELDSSMLESRWQNFIQCLTNENNLGVQEEINLEKQALGDAVVFAHKFLDFENYSKVSPQIDMKIVVKKFILFLQFAIEDTEYLDTIINVLQVIRTIIDETENEDAKVQMQTQINEYGFTKVILNVLCDCQFMDPLIFKQLIMTLNALLQGGNKDVQKTIYEFFIIHKKSEKLFKKISECFQSEIAKIEQKSKQSRISTQTTFFGSEQTQTFNENSDYIQTEEEKNDQESLDTLQYILSFLQQGVEGHYLQLQNFLREQPNAINNHDMILNIVDLLKVFYFEARQQKYYPNMIQCLDTLTELVQGPCAENQLAVSESKFLDIANDLFTHKFNKKFKKGDGVQMQKSWFGKSKITSKSTMTRTEFMNKKNSELEGWMIGRLQNKCLILILSLIENRDIYEPNSIVRRIHRDLLPEILQKHLRKSFQRFEDIYGIEYRMQSFDHLTSIEDPVLNPKQYQEEIQKTGNMYKNVPMEQYLECIIQNGFYIFFLLRYYIEVDPDSVDSLTLELYTKYETAVKNREQHGLKKVFGDNLFGQIASFVHQVLLTSYGYAKKMKKFAEQKVLSKDNDQNKKQKREQKDKIFTEAFNFFAQNTAQIDISRGKQLEIVFFIKLPFTHFLNKEYKTKFKQSVNRDSNKTKVQELMDNVDDWITIMEHEEILNYYFSHNPLVALIANYDKLWKDLAFLFTVILNIMIIGSFGMSNGHRTEEYHLFLMDEFPQERTEKYFQSFGLSMAICSGFVVTFFLVKTLPLIFQKTWKQVEGGIIKQLVNLVVNILRIVFQVLQEMEVLYYIAYGAFGIMGVAIHPFFFTFHLTEILIRYPTLQNIINSVWSEKVAISLSFILFIILVYVFSIIGFLFFRKDFQGNCDDMFICFLFYFDWTFKANGGCSGWINDNSSESESQDYRVGRVVWDTLSNLILIVIMVNMVAGIIIDTFGKLRDEEEDKQQDITEICFICGNNKADFDKQQHSKGFKKHYRVDHYLWNYVFYVAYLKWKDSNEYTGVESYISSKIENKDTSWFPFNKSRTLQKDLQDDIKESVIIKDVHSCQQESLQEFTQLSKVLQNLTNFQNEQKKEEIGDDDDEITYSQSNTPRDHIYPNQDI